jgi:YcaO-like protein with predicted kinase domain
MSSSQEISGTIRERTIEETLGALKPRLREFGITRIADITGLDEVGIPVVTVVRPMARSLSVSQGKGITREQALASGIMESIEVFHAEQQRPNMTLCSMADCVRDTVFISPYSMPMRADANVSGNAAIAWVDGENLFGKPQKKVPAELFDLDFSRREAPPLFLASSNGLASGNSREEAILHGLCEVVERDQISFWQVERDWLHLNVDRRLSIETVDDPVCAGLIDRCLSAGLEILIWHISVNIDVPVFACMISDRHHNTSYPQYTTGHGCHPIASIALSRAITEAAQSRLTHISGLREDMTWARYRDEFLCDTGKNAEFLEKMSRQRPAVDFRQINSVSPEGPRDIVALSNHVMERLREADLANAVVVDLARNDVFSVVYVCVPDLEYFTPKASKIYLPGARMRDFVARNKMQ